MVDGGEMAHRGMNREGFRQPGIASPAEIFGYVGNGMIWYNEIRDGDYANPEMRNASNECA
jgi:hypothetical protein